MPSLQITQTIEIECKSVKNIEHIEKEIMQNTMTNKGMWNKRGKSLKVLERLTIAKWERLRYSMNDICKHLLCLNKGTMWVSLGKF